VIGHEAFGEVVAVGAGVTTYKVGDLVCSPFSTSCGEFCTGPARHSPARGRRVVGWGRTLGSTLDNGSRDVGGVGGGGAECRTARSRVSLRQPLCSCRAPLHSLTSPGNCFYCNQGYTSRCIGGGALLGSAANPGAQAEYLRVPEAEASLFPAPADIKPELLLLMADILPTGYYVAYNARHLIDDGQVDAPKANGGAVVQPVGKRGVAVVIGCGPVSFYQHAAVGTGVLRTDPRPGRSLRHLVCVHHV
jgi:threonine dehydrogenase-like Zn-dependent dehydrogenase